MTSSASSPAFDRVRQKRSCAFAHVCLRRSASISDASTVLTAVQLEAARDHCDRSRPLRRHRMFCVKYATITRRLFRPRRSQPICLCLIVNSSQDDSGCGGNARDPRWARKAGRWQMPRRSQIRRYVHRLPSRRRKSRSQGRLRMPCRCRVAKPGRRLVVSP